MSEVTFAGNTVGDKALYLAGIERGESNERERIIKKLWEWATNPDPQPRDFETEEELRAYLEGEQK